MTSNGSTLVKCPPKNKIIAQRNIQRSPYRSIQKRQILKDILVRAKLSKRLLHVDRSCVRPVTPLLSPLEITAYMTRMRFFIQMLGIISCKLCVGPMHVIVSSTGVAILLGVMVLLLVARLVTFSVQPIRLKRYCDQFYLFVTVNVKVLSKSIDHVSD